MKKLIILIITSLLTSCTTNWDKQIFIDAQNGYTFGVEKALKAGTNPNIKNEHGLTPLHVAAKYGNIYIVRSIIANGGPVDITNNTGDTPLMLAAFEGKTKTVGEIVQSNAKINLQNNKGQTALMLATQKGHLETTNYLLQSQADKYIFDNDGMSAAAYAIIYKQVSVLSQLLNNELNVNQRHAKQHNATLLILAAKFGNTDAIQLLLAHKADIKLKDDQGKDALRIAQEAGMVQAANLLR